MNSFRAEFLTSAVPDCFHDMTAELAKDDEELEALTKKYFSHGSLVALSLDVQVRRGTNGPELVVTGGKFKTADEFLSPGPPIHGERR